MDALFVPLVVLSQVFAVATLILLGVWTGNVLGGFAWDGSMKQFNFHPLFMIIGMVIINGDGEYSIATSCTQVLEGAWTGNRQ